MTDDELLRQYPPRAPGGSLVWTAVVDVSDRMELGQSPLGARFMVPIVGGRFYGGPGHDGLAGKVLAGGADRQLVRPDGPFEWLRRRLLVGTLQSARPDRAAVVVRAWEMDLAGS